MYGENIIQLRSDAKGARVIIDGLDVSDSVTCTDIRVSPMVPPDVHIQTTQEKTQQLLESLGKRGFDYQQVMGLKNGKQQITITAK